MQGNNRQWRNFYLDFVFTASPNKSVTTETVDPSLPRVPVSEMRVMCRVGPAATTV